MDVKFSDYMTVRDAARLWSVTERMVTVYITRERVPGAVKTGNLWLIPKDAQKPEDRRKYNHRHPKKEAPAPDKISESEAGK